VAVQALLLELGQQLLELVLERVQQLLELVLVLVLVQQLLEQQ
jgi:hypothetical protein